MNLASRFSLEIDLVDARRKYSDLPHEVSLVVPPLESLKMECELVVLHLHLMSLHGWDPPWLHETLQAVVVAGDGPGEGREGTWTTEDGRGVQGRDETGEGAGQSGGHLEMLSGCVMCRADECLEWRLAGWLSLV